MLGPVHKEVLHHHPEHPHVVPGQVVLALLLVAGETGAVVLRQEGLDGAEREEFRLFRGNSSPPM